MTIRRLVAGIVDGQSVVLSDSVPSRVHEYTAIPGFSTALVWSTTSDRNGTIVDSVSDSTSYVPGPGETRLLIVTFPPDSVFESEKFDPAAAYAEQLKHLTGLVDHFDPDNPGMHSTPTIDYGIVLEGTLWLELDGGVMKKLEPHCVVIQQGNSHAWRNPGDTPAKIAFVLVGR